MSEKLQDIAAGRTEPKKGFGGWIAGRARRREFWMWTAPALIGAALLGAVNLEVLGNLLGFVVTMIAIRRFHDLGRSGWWIVPINVVTTVLSKGLALSMGDSGIAVAYLAYLAAIIALGSIPGQRGPNAFGPPPGKQDVVETFS